MIWNVIFEAQAEVQCDGVGQAPVVLAEEGVDIGPSAELRSAAILPSAGNSSQPKIGQWRISRGGDVQGTQQTVVPWIYVV